MQAANEFSFNLIQSSKNWQWKNKWRHFSLEHVVFQYCFASKNEQTNEQKYIQVKKFKSKKYTNKNHINTKKEINIHTKKFKYTTYTNKKHSKYII